MPSSPSTSSRNELEKDGLNNSNNDERKTDKILLTRKHEECWVIKNIASKMCQESKKPTSMPIMSISTDENTGQISQFPIKLRITLNKNKFPTVRTNNNQNMSYPAENPLTNPKTKLVVLLKRLDPNQIPINNAVKAKDDQEMSRKRKNDNLKSNTVEFLPWDYNLRKPFNINNNKTYIQQSSTITCQEKSEIVEEEFNSAITDHSDFDSQVNSSHLEEDQAFFRPLKKRKFIEEDHSYCTTKEMFVAQESSVKGDSDSQFKNEDPSKNQINNQANISKSVKNSHCKGVLQTAKTLELLEQSKFKARTQSLNDPLNYDKEFQFKPVLVPNKSYKKLISNNEDEDLVSSNDELKNHSQDKIVESSYLSNPPMTIQETREILKNINSIYKLKDSYRKQTSKKPDSIENPTPSVILYANKVTERKEIQNDDISSNINEIESKNNLKLEINEAKHRRKCYSPVFIPPDVNLTSNKNENSEANPEIISINHHSQIIQLLEKPITESSKDSKTEEDKHRSPIIQVLNSDIHIIPNQGKNNPNNELYKDKRNQIKSDDKISINPIDIEKIDQKSLLSSLNEIQVSKIISPKQVQMSSSQTKGQIPQTPFQIEITKVPASNLTQALSLSNHLLQNQPYLIQMTSPNQSQIPQLHNTPNTTYSQIQESVISENQQEITQFPNKEHITPSIYLQNQGYVPQKIELKKEKRGSTYTQQNQTPQAIDTSKNHQTIPLTNQRFVAQAPVMNNINNSFITPTQQNDSQRSQNSSAATTMISGNEICSYSTLSNEQLRLRQKKANILDFIRHYLYITQENQYKINKFADMIFYLVDFPCEIFHNIKLFRKLLQIFSLWCRQDLVAFEKERVVFEYYRSKERDKNSLPNCNLSIGSCINENIKMEFINFFNGIKEINPNYISPLDQVSSSQATLNSELSQQQQYSQSRQELAGNPWIQNSGQTYPTTSQSYEIPFQNANEQSRKNNQFNYSMVPTNVSNYSSIINKETRSNKVTRVRDRIHNQQPSQQNRHLQWNRPYYNYQYQQPQFHPYSSPSQLQRSISYQVYYDPFSQTYMYNNPYSSNTNQQNYNYYNYY